MSAKDWKRAERLIKSQYQTAAAVADSADLTSFPLSAISMDKSGPPQVDTSMAASTPQHVSTSHTNYKDNDSYHQTITGISQHSLYPVLSTTYTQLQTYSHDGDTQVEKASADFCSYLLDEQEQFAREPNFCKAYSRSTNTSPILGLTDITSPPNSSEVYFEATGSADKQPKQNDKNNKPQPASTDVENTTMADDHRRADKYQSDTEFLDTADNSPTNKVGCYTLTMQINQYITNHHITSRETVKIT